MARDYEGMIEQQEDSVQRAIADPNSPWYGLPYDTVAQWMNNAPAGFNAGMVPGQVIDQGMLAQILGRLNTPGLYEGIDNGMTLEQYLSDPKSMIKVEDGKFVYRPEQSQGDFVSKDRESFLESLGALPFVLAAFSGPFLASLGVTGAGASAMGSADFPTFMGDMAATSGVGSAGAAAGSAADFASSFNPTITPSTVAQSELLYTGGSMPNVAGLSGVGGLTAEGLAALEAMGPSGAGMGVGTTGPLGQLTLDAAGNIVQSATDLANTTGSFPTGVTSTTGTVQNTVAKEAAKTGLSKLLKDHLGIDVDSSTLDLIGKGLGLAVGAVGANKQADASKDLFSQYMSMGAPFREELKALNANPNSFYSSPMFQGALQQGSDALARSLSAKVGNPILNPTALQEMQNYTTRGSLDAFNQRWNQLANAGQLGVGQAANLGTMANQASGNTYNAIGAGLQSVFGNQRDYAAEFLDIARQQANQRKDPNTVYLPGAG